jgi:hypothetical protein
MTSIKFMQVKGGAGTSTVAVAFAARIAAQGRRTLLIGHDADALAAIIGLSGVTDDQRGSILHAGDFAHTDRLPLAMAVLDTCDPSWSIDAFCGQYQADVCILDGTDYEADRTYLVLRGPDYLSLRAACAQRIKCDGVVLVQEAGRALFASDVADVLGLPVLVTLPVDAAISRAVDAGVLVSCQKGAALDALSPEVE